MSQTHHWIAGACVVSLGVGYLAGSHRASSDGTGDSKQKAASPRETRSSSRDRQARESPGDELLAGILKGRSVKDLSDGELVKIVLQLSKSDPTQNPVTRARQAYQLQMLLEKLPASRLEQAAEAITADPESKRDGSTSTIMSALAAKDPQRALAWAKTQKNASSLLSSVLGAMAKDDPVMAAEIYREGLLDGTFGQYDGWQASYGIGSAMARLGKKPLLAFLDALPQQQQGNILSNCYRELPEGERVAMIDEIYQRSKDGRLENWSFKNIFSNAITSDPTQAEEWLAKMEPGKERASLELSSSSSFSHNGDSDKAREWMLRAIAGSQGQEKELLREALNQMAYRNSGDIATFASMLPAGVELKAEDLKSQATNSLYRGFSDLPGLAGAIRDPAEKAKLIVTALEQFTTKAEEGSPRTRMNATDFEIFSRQLQGLNLTGENATKVEHALAAARDARPKPQD